MAIWSARGRAGLLGAFWGILGGFSGEAHPENL